MDRMTLIIKTTTKCNFSCEYCYVDPQLDRTDMSIEIVEALTRQVVELFPQTGKVTFLWHGGEPTLRTMEFFEDAIQMQRAVGRGLKIENCMQSNGSLIDHDLVQKAKKLSLQIGVSLDGPAQLNDLHRKTKGGKGTHSIIMNGLTCQKKSGSWIGALCVVSNKTIDNVEDIYSFFKEQGIHLTLSPVVLTGCATNKTSLSVEPKRFGSAMVQIFEKWFSDDARIEVEPFRSIIPRMLSLPYTKVECCYEKDCQERFIGIDTNGDVYPCSLFVGDKRFKYGNIFNEGLEGALKSALREEVRRRHEALDECQSCRHLHLCYGGCMHTALVYFGSVFQKDYFCESYKMVFDKIAETVGQH